MPANDNDKEALFREFMQWQQKNSQPLSKVVQIMFLRRGQGIQIRLCHTGNQLVWFRRQKPLEQRRGVGPVVAENQLDGRRFFAL